MTVVRLIGGPCDGQLREIPPGPLQVDVLAPYSMELPRPLQVGRYLPDVPRPSKTDRNPGPRTEPNGTVWLKWAGWTAAQGVPARPPHDAPEVKRDANGRVMVPCPVTSEARDYTCALVAGHHENHLDPATLVSWHRQPGD